MKITKLVLFLFIFCLTCNTYIFAEDTTSKPITLEETRPKPTVPTKPKAPSRVQLYAYYNGVGISITSSVILQAEVMIYDNLTGEQYFNGAAMLASSFFCEIPADATSVSIIISTSSSEYQGVLYK